MSIRHHEMSQTPAQKVREKTKILHDLGLVNREAVKRHLKIALLENPNRDVDILLDQKARTMIMEFYDGSREFC